MNFKELETKLESFNFSNSSYRPYVLLERGCGAIVGCEQHVLAYDSSEELWEVYYSERGKKSGRTTFKSESDACSYFIKFIEGNE